MGPLLLQLLVLASAPVLDRALRGRRVAESVVDGALQAIVVGIVLFVVVPLGVAAAGLPAVGALAAGWLGGALAHRWPGGWRIAGGVAVAALLVHALLDGAALSLDEHGEAGSLLALAVILHTVPVGLAAWRVSRARGGLRTAWAVLVLTAAATAAGFAAGSFAWLHAEGAAAGVLQCLLGGALLHIVGEVGAGDVRRASGAGALLGGGVIAALVALHPVPRVAADELGAAGAFLALLGGAAPWLLGGWVVAVAARALGAPSWRGATPADVAVAVPLLGPGVAAAGAVAVAVDALRRGRGPAVPARRAWREVVDAGAPALLVGAGVGALLEPVLPADALVLPEIGATAVAIGVGALARPPVAGAIPLVAVLLHKGLPGAAGAGFLIAAALRGVPRVRPIVALLVAGAGAVAARVAGFGPGVPSLHDAVGTVELAAAAGVGLVGLEVLLRRGPADFLAPLVGGGRAHVHGPGCGHGLGGATPEDLAFAVAGHLERGEGRGWGVRRS